ncbi:hypothetical protein JHK87_006272 [Glycine soja]|nr:hypothetical protein JHK87_006272 [Glycine soja]
MAKPQKPQPKPGCFSFSSFLRVLLCAGNGTSPPVHPYHITESDESKNAHFTKEKMVVNDNGNDDISAPGVVARLMGLDSLPNPKWVVKCGSGSIPDSVPRSRSVNFVDYLLEFDASHVSSHRRVKTSTSFREVPSLVQNQKGNNGNNLFVFCMDGDGNMREEKEGRNEMREVEELRQRKRQGSNKNKESVSVKKERNQGKKNKKISKLKNEPRRVPSSKNGSKGLTRNHHGEVKDLSSVSSNSSKCSSSCSSSRKNGVSSRSRFNTSLSNAHKKGVVEPKFRKNMRNQNPVLKEESECRLENHSPVSVVESNDYYPFLYGTDFLDGPSSVASKSKKWGSPSLLSLGEEVEDSASTNEGYTFIDVNKEAEYYSELMLKLRTLTEQDIRESDCTSKRVRETENFGDICLMFEHKIFDHLLYEVVNEVLELYY